MQIPNGLPFSWDLEPEGPLMCENISFLVDPLLFENMTFQVDGALMALGRRLSACKSQENGMPFSWDVEPECPLLFENRTFHVDGAPMEFSRMLSHNMTFSS